MKNMAKINKVLSSIKLTENGDIAFSSTGNNLLDLLFLSEYFTKHPEHANIGTSEREKLFSMFMRDPRYGMGRRDLGRELMKLSGVKPENVVKAGRFDDLMYSCTREDAFAYLKKEIDLGNELAKKWAPRYSSKDLMLARDFAKYLGMNKQQYGKYVKARTVERCLSSKNAGIIDFEHVPSLAMIKYYTRFSTKEDTAKRFAKYLDDVKSGKAELKIATTSVYDIYRNCGKIDADLFFDKIEKISINCIPVVDTSGSMFDNNDSIGKALALGHYFGTCSTYMKDCAVTFSSRPSVRYFYDDPSYASMSFEAYAKRLLPIFWDSSNYAKQVRSMITGDCSNTDFGAVMGLLSKFGNLPEYIIVLSDMEFDMGSRMTKDEVKRLWEEKGYNTKIVWWNLNGRSKTCPEIDDEGNIFMSGYNPMLLKFIEAGFDGDKFLNRLLDEYERAISK